MVKRLEQHFIVLIRHANESRFQFWDCCVFISISPIYEYSEDSLIFEMPEACHLDLTAGLELSGLKG